MINHRVAPDTIRYSIMFVEKPFQKLGRGIFLVIESVKLQMNSNIPYGTLAVASDNQPMLRWVERYLKPYATLISELRYSCRCLI